METKKKTIKKRIFLSHISIIVISTVLTSLIFNLCLNIYMRLQTRSQLLSAAQIIQKSLNTDILSSSGEGALAEDKEVLKNLLKINRILKQTQTFLDINYAVVNANGKIIYPREAAGEEALIKSKLTSVLNAKSIAASARKNKIIYFKTEDRKYAALVHNASGENGGRLGSLVLYSDLKNSRSLMISVNLILFTILFLTAILALYISNRVSRKLSKPILQLCSYAEKIGDREYKPGQLQYEEDEIGQLAKNMENMAAKLHAYDSTMKTFLQNASHELRTPLMSIQGYAEGIKFNVIEDKEGAAEVIIEESKRLTAIVEDLLYLSKLEGLQDNIELELLDAEELIRGCIEKVNGIAIQKGVKLSFSPKEGNIKLKADEEKLSRAIINILGNCLRYAKKEIAINLERLREKIVITIKDDGQGFDTKELPNVFDRFFKGSGGKHGLGLAITKSIVEKHSGSIIAENSEQGGARFTIKLPI